MELGSRLEMSEGEDTAVGKRICGEYKGCGREGHARAKRGKQKQFH